MTSKSDTNTNYPWHKMTPLTGRVYKGLVRTATKCAVGCFPARYEDIVKRVVASGGDADETDDVLNELDRHGAILYDITVEMMILPMWFQCNRFNPERVRRVLDKLDESRAFHFLLEVYAARSQKPLQVLKYRALQPR